MNRIPLKDISTEVEGLRDLRVNIFRFNPECPEEPASLEGFDLRETPSMTLFMLLNEIRENADPNLNFDFVCRAGICGSCAMLVNGKPRLACRTLTKDLPAQITLLPLPGFELIGDLSVDTGKWMRAMSESLETWVHRQQEALDLCALEEKMDAHTAEQIYELERCIECGCCVAACGTAQMHENFVGAVGINQLARFRLDPRDVRSDGDYFSVLGSEDGVFGCMTLLGCEDYCPKNLPLAQQIAYMRRAMVRAGK